jgi:hypothetical protein
MSKLIPIGPSPVYNDSKRWPLELHENILIVDITDSPLLLLTTCKLLMFVSFTASRRFSGKPQVPKPPTKILELLGISATATAHDGKTLSFLINPAACEATENLWLSTRFPIFLADCPERRVFIYIFF